MTALSATPARPILFSGAMVREVIGGTKTQTRRVMKPQPASDSPEVRASMIAPGVARIGVLAHAGVGDDWRCPYGVPGDFLWVRETWARDEQFGGILYRADHAGDDPIGDGWKPSIHMPRAVSRLTLQIADVRVQRLKDITEVDAKAEGADKLVMDDDCKFYQDDAKGTHRCGFAGLWNHINGQRPGADWDANPYVWALTFKAHHCNVDAMAKAAA